MYIGIMGTRGIPNQYGGFEQCAQFLSEGLVRKGHRVAVYSSLNHPWQDTTFNGVEIIHCKDPESWMGTIGQFIYDRNCITDARKRSFDVLLHLGYTSDSIWHRRWPTQTAHVMNMDGMEWKRDKYGRMTKRFLRFAESLAIKHADLLIADSKAVASYIKDRYHKRSEYIPYGAERLHQQDDSHLNKYGISPFTYSLLLARMEPENNVETVIRGYISSSRKDPLLIVSNPNNRYGKKLQATYRDQRVKFIGSIYNKDVIDNLRHFSDIYFHGHSAGGTNPSLLEAMACGCTIFAHENVFNQAVLDDNAFFFSNPESVKQLLDTAPGEATREEWRLANYQKVEREFRWDKIIDGYEAAIFAASKLCR